MEDSLKVNTCYVLGKDSLTTECIKILINQGYNVLGIVSEHESVSQIARQHQLPLLTLQVLEERLVEYPADFLFSIVNHHILPERLLSLPKRYAINYHDGPLPSYGGVRAPSWAILHDERSHGVTWHVMTKRVDQGDILRQRIFPVAVSETAKSLNIKCYENAVQSFRSLLDDIAQDKLTPKPQPKVGRSYFSRIQKPEGNGLLSWQWPAKKIDRMCRALDFGDQSNPLATAKCLLQEKVFIVKKYGHTDKRSTELPGTVTEATDRYLQIATSTEDFRLLAVGDASGRIYEASDLQAELGLKKGDQLFVPDDDYMSELCELSKAYAEHEEFWVNCLLEKQPLNPYREPVTSAHAEAKFAYRNLRFPSSPRESVSASAFGSSATHDILLTVCLIYFYRINNYEPYDIDYFDATKLPENEKFWGFFSKYIPVRVGFMPRDVLFNAINKVKLSLKGYARFRGFSFDVYQRNNELAYQAEQIAPPFAIEVTDDPENWAAHPRSIVSIAVHDNGLIVAARSKELAQRTKEHLQNVVNRIVDDPLQAISDINFLTANEKYALSEWRDTEKDFSLDHTIHECFEEQVKKTPNATAVEFQSERLSYQTLNRRANQLAHYLRKHNVQQGDLVVVCMERSVEMLVSILAIFKVGAAYVPIDPTLPDKRIQFILQDCNSNIVLAQSGSVKKLKTCSAKLVLLDQEQMGINQCSTDNLDSGADASSLAYVIYTSGSTGKPKGVLVEHRGVINLYHSQRTGLGLGPEDRVLSFAPFTFDAFVWEVSGALLNGAVLCLTPKAAIMPGDALAQTLKHLKITYATIPPSILSATPRIDLLDLRMLIVAGEPCPAALLKTWGKKATMVNAYGPTEATVCASMGKINGAKGRPHIGKPIPNVHVSVLDKFQNRMPLGVVGELYIGGVGVARGYINQPEKTKLHFVEDPLQYGAPMYRTGDSVRWLEDGNLDYVERVDNQIKLHGLRIELEEVEACLLEHEDIQQCAVTINRDAAGNKRLVAYFVPDKQNVVEHISIVKFLKSRLPDYMVPSIFVRLSEMPRTDSGKIRRKALPLPTQADVIPEHTFVSPRTEEERMLAEIWCDVLHLERVGLYDDFFYIGGHSIKATQVISRINEAFRIKCPLNAIFNHSDIASLVAYIRSLRGHAEKKPIKADRSGKLPLSLAQNRFWFLNQYEGGVSARYNVPMAFHLHGDLSHDALEKSITKILERHEVLRTVFPSHQGAAEQKILPAWDIKLKVESITEADLVTKLFEESHDLFQLETGPLFRARLFKFGKAHHVLALTVHHLVFDGWSYGLFVSELSLLYRASLADQSVELPALEMQYADFASWQNKLLASEQIKPKIKYWKDKLTGFSKLELPTDFPRPSHQVFEGGVHKVKLNAMLLGDLKKLARKNHSTLFMVLLSVFNVLLSRYSSQDDIVVGTPVANRTYKSIENLLGCFVNTLALRTDLSGNPTFSELIARVKQNCLEAYASQEVPFEYVVDALQVDRDPSRSPIFQTMFILQNASDSVELSLPGLEVEKIPSYSQQAKYDLSFILSESVDGLECEVEYCSALFSAATIKQMTEHFRELLLGVINAQNKPIRYLPLLSNVEHQRILRDWNQTGVSYSQNDTLLTLFEQQLGHTPNKVAVKFGKSSLTYQELDKLSNQLAHGILRVQHGTDCRDKDGNVLVGLCVERSLNIVIGLLGILKAGAAYIPLDPDYPDDRLVMMLDDAQTKLVVSQKSVKEDLPVLAENGRQVFCIDGEDENIAENSTTLPAHSVSPNDLAYVIYTSGSTGLPKGTLIEHHSVVNCVNAIKRLVDVKDSDVFLAITSLSFDVSALDYYLPFAVGATTVIADYHVRQDGVKLAKLLQDSQATVMQGAPSAWEMLTDCGWNGREGFKILTAGEALSYELAQKLAERGLVYNIYGPTEVTVYSTLKLVKAGELISIGKPIDNLQAYVLDEYMQPMPVGLPGELYIGGVGLARGYLRRPELNRARFIPSPFSEDKDAKLYKTGDLVRWLPDGNIFYMGRLDSQVKIRGFRIELGSIEETMMTHPAVRSCVAIVKEVQGYEKQIVLYYVAEDFDNKPPSIVLKDYLRDRLPPYMMPNFIITVETMPLSPSGKIDRLALTERSIDKYLQATEDAKPDNDIESEIVNVFAELLRLPSIGAYDNFFDVGAHSLMLVRACSMLNKKLDKKLEVIHLFTYPSAKALAQFISRADAGEDQTDADNNAQTRMQLRKQRLAKRKQNLT